MAAKHARVKAEPKGAATYDNSLVPLKVSTFPFSNPACLCFSKLFLPVLTGGPLANKKLGCKFQQTE